MYCSCCQEANNPEDAKYCFVCGEKLPQVDMYSLIELYFHRGYRYQAIVDLLSKFHGINIHVRTLKRKLHEMGLKRRGNEIDVDIVRETIRHEMQGAGELADYRYIWLSQFFFIQFQYKFLI